MKVDIIIPFYNTNIAFIQECLNSIKKQTFQDYRIILINDYSNTHYPFTSTDKIFYLKNDARLGISNSVNIGLNLVNAEYCIRIDSDDCTLPTLLEKEVNFLDKNPDYIAVCCDTYKLINGIKTDKVFLNRPVEWNFNDVLNNKYHGYGYAGGLMFRSNIIKKVRNDESYPVCEDFDFHMQLLRYGKIYSIKNDKLYYYRIHAGQTVKQYPKDIKNAFIKKTLDKIKLWNLD